MPATAITNCGRPASFFSWIGAALWRPSVAPLDRCAMLSSFAFNGVLDWPAVYSLEGWRSIGLDFVRAIMFARKG